MATENSASENNMNTTKQTQDAAEDYGFLADLRSVSFHWNEDMSELTLRAPQGCKIPLSAADGIKALTPEAIREARLANNGRGQF